VVEPPRPGRVAVAVLHSDPPQLFLAESEETLSRVLALRLVAQRAPSEFSTDEIVDDIRAALLEEEWARAVELWLMSTDEALDVWGSEELVWDGTLDDERTAMEIRLAPIFEDPDDGGVA
jgi:hypothetical protein